MFQGPEPDDIFFGIVRRGRAMAMFMDVGVDPVPNYTRDVNKASPAGVLFEGAGHFALMTHVPQFVVALKENLPIASAPN